MNNIELEEYLLNYKKVDEQYRDSDKDLKVLYAASLTEISKENSNDIVVYIGTYIRRGNNLFMTYDENLNASFKQYIDIETGELYQIELKDIKEFEQSHKIVKDDNEHSLHYSNKKYNDTKIEFFKTLLTDTEENAVKKVLKLDLK